MNRPCLGYPGHRCAALTPRTRCLDCQRQYDRQRRPGPDQRYGPDRKRRHHAAINEEPWCHYPGCTLPITAANPLTADHPITVASGGSPDQPLVPMCKAHNSGRR